MIGVFKCTEKRYLLGAGRYSCFVAGFTVDSSSILAPRRSCSFSHSTVSSSSSALFRPISNLLLISTVKIILTRPVSTQSWQFVCPRLPSSWLSYPELSSLERRYTRRILDTIINFGRIHEGERTIITLAKLIVFPH